MGGRRQKPGIITFSAPPEIYTDALSQTLSANITCTEGQPGEQRPQRPSNMRVRQTEPHADASGFWAKLTFGFINGLLRQASKSADLGPRDAAYLLPPSDVALRLVLQFDTAYVSSETGQKAWVYNGRKISETPAAKTLVLVRRPGQRAASTRRTRFTCAFLAAPGKPLYS